MNCWCNEWTLWRCRAVCGEHGASHTHGLCCDLYVTVNVNRVLMLWNILYIGHVWASYLILRPNMCCAWGDCLTCSTFVTALCTHMWMRVMYLGCRGCVRPWLWLVSLLTVCLASVVSKHGVYCRTSLTGLFSDQLNPWIRLCPLRE